MKNKPPHSRHSRWPVILIIITAVAGIGISLHIRARIAQTETITARLTAETLRLNTERELNLFAEVLESVRALHALSDAVNQEAMNEFIEKGLIHQHAVLGAFGLTQRISHRHRLQIESSDQTGPGIYTVVQQGPSDTWIPTGPRKIYYPLTWQNKAEALGVPIGFDFTSTPEARRIVQRIEQTKKTSLVPVPFKKGTSTSYWVFAPVINNSPPPLLNQVLGLAVAAIEPDAILQQVSASSASEADLQLELLSEEIENGGTIRRTVNSWLYRHPLHAIDTQWVFECSLPLTATGHRSAAALIIGLIITALMTSLLLLLGGRTRKIEVEVRERTEELNIANATLEKSLHERARMEEEMNELAARERRRVGRDLHDSLGQKLTGAVFLSRSLLDYFSSKRISNIEQEISNVKGRKTEDGRQRTEDSPSNQQLSPIDNRPESEAIDNLRKQITSSANGSSTLVNRQAHAKTLNETLKSSVSQVRKMARGLASVTLNDESLDESLEQLAEEMTALYDIPCHLTQTGQLPALDRKTKEQLYFIAREAVNNAARHAQAKLITIQFSGDISGWTLRIKDDGKGLSEGSQPLQSGNEGMGLRIMRHRARLIGAQFSIHSTMGQGTRIEVTSNA